MNGDGISRAGAQAAGDLPRQLFISSTSSDLYDYRQAIKNDLDGLQVAAYLSEGWTGGYEDTLARCAEELHAADGYIGVFAYWYGSIPPGQTRSVTHLEFDWACERWPRAQTGLSQVRVALFVPGWRDPTRKDKCPAQEELERKAEELKTLAKVDVAEHDTRLKSFRDHANDWRRFQFFHDKNDLGKVVIQTCYTWVKRLLVAAQAAKPAKKGHEPALAELGRLGRRPQRDALVDLRAGATNPALPALCALVYGPEENGHRECHEYLIADAFNDEETKTVRGRPPTLERYGLGALVHWVSNQVLEPGVAPPATVTGLAASVDKRLEYCDLYLVLTDVHLFEAGLAGFHDTFWKPLCEELSALRQRRGTRHRLFLLAGFIGDKQADWVGITEYDAEATESVKIHTLPPLGPFVAKDVRRWLDEMKVEDRPPGRREAFVKTVLARSDGAPDSTPANVFRRILDLPIWQ